MHALIDEQDAAQLKARILTSGLTVSELVKYYLGFGIYIPRI
jgi:catalase (peroxidase I)